MQEYNKLVEDDKMRLRYEEVQRNFLYEQIASLQAQIKRAEIIYLISTLRMLLIKYITTIW